MSDRKTARKTALEKLRGLTLAEMQTESKCEHVREIGYPCDIDSGGWWDCGCAVFVRSVQRALNEEDQSSQITPTTPPEEKPQQ